VIFHVEQFFNNIQSSMQYVKNTEQMKSMYYEIILNIMLRAVK
jgi:hypothetical protein